MTRTAVIMAAGLGIRFGWMTELMPKGFIECGGISMVERSIRTLLDCGIERIIIGTGHLKEKYEELAKKYNCREAVGNDDFLLLESDLVYEKKAILSLLESPEPDIMLITPVTKFQDQYYVEYGEGNRLTRCSTVESELDAKGELVGIHKLSNEFFRLMCEDYGKKTEELPKLGYEYELLTMSQEIRKVYVLRLDDLWWYEIDDVDDLAYAEENIIWKIIKKSH